MTFFLIHCNTEYLNLYFQAVVPLMKYLEKELQYMNENLVQENFNRYLNFFFFLQRDYICIF